MISGIAEENARIEGAIKRWREEVEHPDREHVIESLEYELKIGQQWELRLNERLAKELK